MPPEGVQIRYSDSSVRHDVTDGDSFLYFMVNMSLQSSRRKNLKGNKDFARGSKATRPPGQSIGDVADRLHGTVESEVGEKGYAQFLNTKEPELRVCVDFATHYYIVYCANMNLAKEQKRT